MYAIIKDGAKQYRVSEGEKIILEKKTLNPGEEIQFPEVLLYAAGEEVRIGQPVLKDIKVTGKIEDHFKGDKVKTIKYKKRKGYRRKKGHRQNYTTVLITQIKPA